jgi:O-6-methylguanine DNA methyltransferase
MAAVSRDRVLIQLTCGHATQAAAVRGLDLDLTTSLGEVAWPALAKKIKAYAAGKAEDFSDIDLDLEHLGPFERRVIEHCRRIPYGQTLSYGALAALAGSPRAARAVGNAMATTRFPLVVPCHRVISASGGVGSHSAAASQRLKLRLLEQGGARKGGKLRSSAAQAAR